MYIPKHYQGKDMKATIEFMKKFNFGVLITNDEGVPLATHLPFHITEQGEDIIITSHLSKANPQNTLLRSGESLIIFSEPHAYISPTHYDSIENVPTWNYVAVHAYGKTEIITSEEETQTILEDMIELMEPSYRKQWNDLTTDYKTRMMKGITAFKMKVTRLESKEKLSQNKKEHEQERIAASLSKSSNNSEKELASYMKK